GVPRRPRHPAHLPLPARHRLGGRPLVPARGVRRPRGDRRPIPAHRPRRPRRRVRTTPTPEETRGTMTNSVTGREAYVIDALRTPVGKRGGSLSGQHPAVLGPPVIRAVAERTGMDPEVVDDVIFGCVATIGPQAGNIGRSAWLAAGMPLGVPRTTVDRQCGSSQQAVHFGAQAVMSGTQDVILFGGVQNMSALPISSAILAGRDYGFDDTFSRSTGC